MRASLWRLWLFPLPLRLRLTLWYTLSLGFILLLFSAFLYSQVRRSLVAQVDTALQLAANQAFLSVSDDVGNLTFQNARDNPEAVRQLNDDFVIHLLTSAGVVADTLTSENEAPRFPAQTDGFITLRVDGEPWRVYSQAMRLGSLTGQLQVAQEMEPVMVTLANFRTQLLLGLALALFLAGVGGFFLASRALRPIDHMTRTAQTTSVHDLDGRIHYTGPADEVGRLAQTFDDMLDRLQAAFARERRFTGDAAHELRTPLTALKGRIGVTLSRPRQPATYVETLAEMEQQVDRLIRLSHDLLLLARLDQVQLQRQFEKIEVANLIGVVVEQVRPLANAKSITLTENIPPSLTIQGDLNLLIRLLMNLLDNAVKYTLPGGQVTITVSLTSEVTIAISDTGSGIPAVHLPHLFERFYRVEADRGRADDNGQGGAGLGLAIAYEIARTHDGRLTVQSKPGQGTTFLVHLPLRS